MLIAAGLFAYSVRSNGGYNEATPPSQTATTVSAETATTQPATETRPATAAQTTAAAQATAASAKAGSTEPDPRMVEDTIDQYIFNTGLEQKLRNDISYYSVTLEMRVSGKSLIAEYGISNETEEGKQAITGQMQRLFDSYSEDASLFTDEMTQRGIEYATMEFRLTDTDGTVLASKIYS